MGTKPETPQDKADALLALIIQHQDGFFRNSSPDKTAGERIAGFISELRPRLIQMYQADGNG
jgi:hypothetical protein